MTPPLSQPGSKLPASDALKELEGLAAAAAEHRERRVAPETRRYHEADWAQYASWCDRLQVPSLPVDPRLVALYLTDMARQHRPDGTPRYKASSLKRHVASLAHKHYETGGGRGLGEHEAISDVLSGIRRLRQERTEGKQALLLDDVVGLIYGMDHNHWPYGVTASRDAFSILLGFSTAMRRSELTALRNRDVTLHPQHGLYLQIGASKTDQEGAGYLVAVPYGRRPVSCLPCLWVRWQRLQVAKTRGERMRLVLQTPDVEAWQHICREAAPQPDPTQFLLRPVTKAGEIHDRGMSAAAFNMLLKRRLEAEGYDAGRYGAHSLRAGFVTQARENGADLRAVRKQTRHASDATVEVYDRANPLIGNAVNVLGL